MPGSLVTVNVILNNELEATERKINYDAKTVITTQQETTETNSQKSGGGPGVALVQRHKALSRIKVYHWPVERLVAIASAMKKKSAPSTINSRHQAPNPRYVELFDTTTGQCQRRDSDELLC